MSKTITAYATGSAGNPDDSVFKFASYGRLEDLSKVICRTVYEDEKSEHSVFRANAGTILAAISIMRYCYKHDIDSVIIKSPYQNLSKWASGVKKPRNRLSKLFLGWYKKVSEKVKIEFELGENPKFDKYCQTLLNK